MASRLHARDAGAMRQAQAPQRRGHAAASAVDAAIQGTSARAAGSSTCTADQEPTRPSASAMLGAPLAASDGSAASSASRAQHGRGTGWPPAP